MADDVPPQPAGALTERLGRLRADLAGVTVDTVNELLGPVADAALGREQSLPARLAVLEHPDEPLATLIGCFVLGQEYPRHRLAAALPTLGLDDAGRLGLLVSAGSDPDDRVRAAVDLRPYAAVDALGTADWWLVSDLGELATGGPLEPDHVLGVGGASITLARSTLRTPVGRVLDLGTGCGVQALHAARHARTVVGTDVSARALEMARMNWVLNAATLGSAQITGRRGSLLEPVAGEQFDLVVSNPPFVITPRSVASAGYEYRDAGMVGDELVHRLVSSLGSVLAPGGVAQLLGNWEHRDGVPWTERLGAWLDEADATSRRDGGPGLDAWVVQREVQDPAEYAETWIRDAGQHLGKDADELYAAWLADFRSRNVEAVGFGLITLRRPQDAGQRFRRLEDRRGGTGLPAGAEVAAGLTAQDWLARHDDAAVLAARLSVAGDVTEERHYLPGAEDPSVILLRQGGGAGRVVQASTGLAGLVGACSGELTVGQLTGALAHLLEVPAAELAAELLPAGLLTP